MDLGRAVQNELKDRVKVEYIVDKGAMVACSSISKLKR